MRPDQQKRMELMHQAEKIAIDNDAWAPIYYYVSKALVSQTDTRRRSAT